MSDPKKQPLASPFGEAAILQGVAVDDRAQEMAVLGAMMLSDRASDECVGLLNPSDFHVPEHRRIFRSMRALRERGDPIDFLSVMAEIQDASEGPTMPEGPMGDYLIQVSEFVPSAENSLYYARRVGEAAWRRRALEALKKAHGSLTGGEETEGVRAALKAIVEDERSGAEGVFELADVDLEGGQDGVPTGFPTLDKATGCGWPIGQTGFVSAIHKGGKTALMVQSYRRVWEDPDPSMRAVYCLMADLNRKQLFRRIVKQRCGVGGDSPDTAKYEAYQDAVASVRAGLAGRGLCYDSSKSGRTIEEMESFVRAAHGRKPLRAVFVDYIQKIQTREKGLDGTRRMEHVSDRLKVLAEDLGVAVIVGSQVSHGPDGTITTKYARAMEEDAGVVVRVSREETDNPYEDSASIDVPYNRFGPGGIRIKAAFDKSTVSFREVAA